MKKLILLFLAIAIASCEPVAIYNSTKPYKLSNLSEGNVVCNCLAYTQDIVSFRLEEIEREFTVPKKQVDFYKMHANVDEFEGKPYVIYEYLGDKNPDIIHSGNLDGKFLFVFPEHCIEELSLPRVSYE